MNQQNPKLEPRDSNFWQRLLLVAQIAGGFATVLALMLALVVFGMSL